MDRMQELAVEVEKRGLETDRRTVQTFVGSYDVLTWMEFPDGTVEGDDGIVIEVRINGRDENEWRVDFYGWRYSDREDLEGSPSELALLIAERAKEY